MHILGVHGADEATDGLDHDGDVGCLDGDDHVVEAVSPAHAQKLHGALHHAGGGVAVAAHDAVGERAVVDADADGGGVGGAELEEGAQGIVDALQLAGVFFVGVFELFEGAAGVDEVAGVDAYFLHLRGGFESGARVEVDVGHERRREAFGAEAAAYLAEVGGFAHALGGVAEIFCAGFNDAATLTDAGFGVGGWHRGHGLDPDGVAAAERRRPYGHFVSGPAFVIEY